MNRVGTPLVTNARSDLWFQSFLVKSLLAFLECVTEKQRACLLHFFHVSRQRAWRSTRIQRCGVMYGILLEQDFLSVRAYCQDVVPYVGRARLGASVHHLRMLIGFSVEADRVRGISLCCVSVTWHVHAVCSIGLCLIQEICRGVLVDLIEVLWFSIHSMELKWFPVHSTELICHAHARLRFCLSAFSPLSQSHFSQSPYSEDDDGQSPKRWQLVYDSFFLSQDTLFRTHFQEFSLAIVPLAITCAPLAHPSEHGIVMKWQSDIGDDAQSKHGVVTSTYFTASENLPMGKAIHVSTPRTALRKVLAVTCINRVTTACV